MSRFHWAKPPSGPRKNMPSGIRIGIARPALRRSADPKHSPIAAPRRLVLDQIPAPKYCIRIQLLSAIMNGQHDIDTRVFELGMPTRLEMLEQQCLLMQSEYELATEMLDKAQTDVRRLISMLDTAEQRRDLATRERDKAEYILKDFRGENDRLEKRHLEHAAKIRRLENQLTEAKKRLPSLRACVCGRL